MVIAEGLEQYKMINHGYMLGYRVYLTEVCASCNLASIVFELVSETTFFNAVTQLDTSAKKISCLTEDGEQPALFKHVCRIPL